MTRHCSLEMLSSFVDRELEEGKRKWVEEHVSGCTACSDRLAGLEQVVRQLQRLEGVSPPRRPAENGDRLADRIVALKQAAGLPQQLRQVRIDCRALSGLAEQAAAQWTGKYNPRPLGPSEALALYEAAY